MTSTRRLLQAIDAWVEEHDTPAHAELRTSLTELSGSLEKADGDAPDADTSPGRRATARAMPNGEPPPARERSGPSPGERAAARALPPQFRKKKRPAHAA